ncbi:glycoside hydrolase family 16 protein [Auriscalpium vulgare]|uniref:Glycoside hydrolase family 16 protein n=1 Tax=Auriscalpium vulgare TaxID=40419 RepID=A0ACB8RUX4_9AGAM|nr:glycoside hydrolase family 16 protein [Auriscalpium vulgare]
MYLNRIASEDAQALGSQFSSMNRGSMILYRLANEDEHGALLPPPSVSGNRDSVFSTSGESIWSLSSDSKYPSGALPAQRGLVPYAYDPSFDDKEPADEEDMLHEPESLDKTGSIFSWRGLMNVGVLVLLIAALLAMFIAYPVITYVHDNTHNLFLDEAGNTRTNQTVPVTLFDMPTLIDSATPDSAKTRTGFDNEDYVLVFSDEFNTDGRSFYPGDDPFWEAADLWYWATADEEWYDPRQVTTSGGSLHILMENVETNGLPYRSGMLQSWNKFCFTSGYIEVNLTLPGPNSETRGYWPGAWTMGNLGRPGYGATTDGTWPYSYDSCDVGTYPNQTLPDGSGPAAALDSDASSAKYNNRLSYLTGQKLSSCTCSGEDHPGPDVSHGRGAPEIDILEAEHNKHGDGGVVSQSAQFAPFTHDYLYSNDTSDEWYVYNTAISSPNNYHGSAVQQAVSGITQLPDDIFAGSGQKFYTFGFEYFADPKNREAGYITWQMDGQPTVRMGATAVGPDQGTDGSGVGQRLIPEEPMSIVLNLGISPNWQTIDTTTMTFPSELLIDYVRVYQRKDSQNIGCNPPDYPTTDYIARHPEAYGNPQLKTWTGAAADGGAGYTFPKNGLVRLPLSCLNLCINFLVLL